MSILENDDFIGEVKLNVSDTYGNATLSEAINITEKDVLVNLFQYTDLYTNFIADLTATTPQIPQTAKYTELLNGTTYEDDCERTIVYDGLKRMLKLFTFDKYLEDNPTYNTNTGQVESTHENGKQISTSKLIAVRTNRVNEAIALYRQAIKFIYDNRDTYLSADEQGVWSPVIYGQQGRHIKTSSPFNKYYKDREFPTYK